MSDDIVQRLRSDWYGKPSDAVLDYALDEAAAEITRLRASLAEAERKLAEHQAVYQYNEADIDILNDKLAEAERERDMYRAEQIALFQSSPSPIGDGQYQEALEIIEEQSEKLERAEADLTTARGKLEKLVAKLAVIEADSTFQGIWGFLHAHGYQYAGPDWRDDLADARAFLERPATAADPFEPSTMDAEAEARIARYEEASVQNDAGWRERLAEARMTTDVVDNLKEAIAEGAGDLADRCVIEITRLRAELAACKGSVTAIAIRDLQAALAEAEREVASKSEQIGKLYRVCNEKADLSVRLQRAETALAAVREVMVEISALEDVRCDEAPTMARACLEHTATEPAFKPCIVQWDEVGATEMVLEDTLIVYQPWGPYKGHAVDLGYNEAGKLVGIKIWDHVAERTTAAAPTPEEAKAAP